MVLFQKSAVLNYTAMVGASLLVHCAGAIVISLLEPGQAKRPDQVHIARVKISETKPVSSVPTAAPEPVKTPPPPKEPPKPKPKPEKTRKARAREDERVKPQEVSKEQEVQEIRGGLSDSTALNSANQAAGPAIAQGNSAEVGVDPSKGDLPPPAPVAPGTNSDAVDYSAIAVEEAFASSSADCSGALPELELTDDAVNAGLTTGRLTIEVIVDDTGRVRQPRLIKGTGYQIDRVALEAVLKMQCKPAQENGKSVVVRKELRFDVVDY